MKKKYMKPATRVAASTTQSNLLAGSHGHWTDAKPNQGNLWEDDEEEQNVKVATRTDYAESWTCSSTSLFD